MEQTQQIKEEEREFDFYIYNHEQHRFLKNYEIEKYILDYANFCDLNFLDFSEKIEAFREIFCDYYVEYETDAFCEWELIEKPLIIFGITDDIEQVNRLKELVKDSKKYKRGKRKNLIKENEKGR